MLYEVITGNQFDLMGSWNQSGYGDGAPEPAKLTGSTYSTINGGGANPRIFNLGLPKSQLMVYYKKTFSSGDLGIMVLNDYYNSDPVNRPKLTHSNYTLGITPNFKSGDLKYGGQFYYTGGTAAKKDDGLGGTTEIDFAGFMANAYVQHTGILGSPLSYNFV